MSVVFYKALIQSLGKHTPTHTISFFYVNINVQLQTWFLGREHVIFLPYLKILGFVFVSHWVLLFSKHQQREKKWTQTKKYKVEGLAQLSHDSHQILEKRVWDIKWQSLCKSEFHHNLSWSSGNVNLSKFEISCLETKQPKNTKNLHQYQFDSPALEHCLTMNQEG